MKITTKKIAIIAMLVALEVLFSRPFAINTNVMKIGLGFTASVFAGMLFGPVWSAVTAGMADLLGALLFPTGAYFPGFTITAAITGLIFGIGVYKKEITWARAFLIAFINCLLITLLANTWMISHFFHVAFKPLFATRLIQFAIMTTVQTIVIKALGTSKAAEYIKKSLNVT